MYKFFKNILNLIKFKINIFIIFCILSVIILTNNYNKNFIKIFFSIIGIFFLSSSSFIINNILERNIDKKMNRTKNRVLVKKKININIIILILIIFLFLGIIILYKFVNFKTTFLTFFIFIFYSIIYTKFIKPYTIYNVVLGGISGALLPILSCFIVSSKINLKIIFFCIIIFLWTPPHFWSLSLYFYKDYKNSNLYMLPKIYGKKITRKYILFYSILLILFTFLIFIFNFANKIYFFLIFILNIVFFFIIYKLCFYYKKYIYYLNFIFSIKYLFFFFLFLIIDNFYYFKN
ncbi:putative protoheme IX farnesyltransferase [Candidatus Zinderia insecticola CARI]|uniref:Protoheme IX farnesyltransferase n=1 Tax=Zinderia insecticola (strain CARI) TaxID=871271 RepID=E0TJ57_ZINIC|nr:putative protoheme IX farnesyltransferase [Candidatus Zinderia insecticola CARI]